MTSKCPRKDCGKVHEHYDTLELVTGKVVACFRCSGPRDKKDEVVYWSIDITPKITMKEPSLGRCDVCDSGLYQWVNWRLGFACDYCGDYHPNDGESWKEECWITRTTPLPKSK